LRGQAQGVLGNLPDSSRQDFKQLSKALEERFAPANQTELYRTQLRDRRQKATETLPELGQDIRRLVNLAYSTAPNDVKETLAKEQFVDALVGSEMRLRVKQTRPINLNDAIRTAVELEAFNMAESRREQSHGYLRATRIDDDTRHNVHFEDLLKTIQTQLTSLNEEVQVLKKQKGNSYFPGRRNHNPKRFNNAQRDATKQGRSRDDIICFNCNKKGHIAKNCGVGPQTKPKEEDGKARLNTSSASKNGKNMNGAVGVNRLAAESGMFVKAKVNGLEVNLLVDTGATVTLISKELYERMKDPVKTQMNRDIYSAGGEKLNIFGKTVVDVEIGKLLASSVAVIADISIDGILGLDFQKSQDCVIDVGRGIMRMKGFDIQLSFEGNIGCYRVTVAETVTLPPRTENIVRGKVKDKCCSLNGAHLLNLILQLKTQTGFYWVEL